MLIFDGLGGVEALTDRARENREEFYKLYARLIPTEQRVAVADGQPLATVSIRFASPKTASSAESCIADP